MSKVTLLIDGVRIQAPEGATILQAAKANDIYIPALCSHRGDSPFACRLCGVAVVGRQDFPMSCELPVAEGMTVWTNNPMLARQRRRQMGKLLQQHPSCCLNCPRVEPCDGTVCQRKPDYEARCVTCVQNNRCELQKAARYTGLGDQLLPYRNPARAHLTEDPFFERDYNLCINCGQCVTACKEILGVEALAFNVGPDGAARVSARLGGTFQESDCRFCGVCVEVCPTGALSLKAEKTAPLAGRPEVLVPCRHRCPAGVDIPSYVRYMAEGKPGDAFAVVREKTPFAATLGYVCTHPCEDECRRSELNEPVAIRALKRCAAEHDDGAWRSRIVRSDPTGRRVAVVGSGPAGLTAAYYMARLGHAVTVFEAASKPGGMMQWGIPRFQSPQECLDKEIADIQAMGVEIRLNFRVDDLDFLQTQGFDCVYLAPGLQLGRKLRIPGAEGEGTLAGLAFLAAASEDQPVSLGTRVLVLGGGDVAVDCARVARRLGAREVAMACLESRESMPGHGWLIEEAAEEGVAIYPSLAFTEVVRENGAVKGVMCRRVKSMKFDEQGRLQVETIPGTDFLLEADTVIFAVGQGLVPMQGWEGVLVSPRGTMVVDPVTMQTGRAGVFAGGDAASGPASVAEATAAGRKAAQAVDRYLGGPGLIDEEFVTAEVHSLWMGREEAFAARNGLRPSLQPAEARSANFDLVELPFGQEQARIEASRCLGCVARTVVPGMTPIKAREAATLGQ